MSALINILRVTIFLKTVSYALWWSSMRPVSYLRGRRSFILMQWPSQKTKICCSMSKPTHTYICCRHQCVCQHGDVVVSVEPRHEQYAESHVDQERHQDVGFSADGQTEDKRRLVTLSCLSRDLVTFHVAPPSAENGQGFKQRQVHRLIAETHLMNCVCPEAGLGELSVLMCSVL